MSFKTGKMYVIYVHVFEYIGVRMYYTRTHEHAAYPSSLELPLHPCCSMHTYLSPAGTRDHTMCTAGLFFILLKMSAAYKLERRMYTREGTKGMRGCSTCQQMHWECTVTSVSASYTEIGMYLLYIERRTETCSRLEK